MSAFHYGDDLEEERLFARRWRYDCNHDHPNMALDGFAPKQRLAMAA